MKTWTNPTVEELEVKMTALYEIIEEVEWFNGKLDGSLIIGGAQNGENGSENGGENGGDQGEGGLGTES